MLKNFLLTSFRSLIRNKTYFLLGTLGLSLGISCLISIYVITDFQSSYDQHQTHYSSIYRVIGSYQVGDESGKTQTVPHPLAAAIRPEISGVAAISNTFMLNEQVNIPLADNQLKKIKQERIGFVQPPFFDILTFEWLAGSPDLSNPDGVYLSQSTADKFFGKEGNLQNLLGKVIVLANTHTLSVRGIYQDLPENTDYPFNMIVDYQKQEGVNPYFGGGKIWGRLNGGTQCLLRIAPTANPKQVERSVQLAFEKANQVEGYQLSLQPLAKVHTEAIGNYSGIVFDKKYVIISYALAILLAVIGSINFINLTTARAVKRAREVGIRKVMGGRRSDLISQFLLETFVMVGVALIIGFVLAGQILALFNAMLDSSLQLQDVTPLQWVGFSGIVLVAMTLLSGLYPALLLSNFSALSAIKIKMSNIDRQSKLPLRKILVSVQFAFSILLIMGVIVIFSQLRYMRTYDMGFESDNIVSLQFPKPDTERQQRLKRAVEALPGVSQTSLHLGSPLANTNNNDKYYNPEQSQEQAFSTNMKSIDESYLELFDLQLISGRNITKTDPSHNILITEIGLKTFKLGNAQEALGKTLKSEFSSDLKIVGVIADFNANSLKEELMPVALYNNPDGYYELAAEISSGDVAATMTSIEATWNELYPELIIEYSFLDDRIANRYRFEEVMGKSIGFMVLIALVICILGLYGLTDYMANAKRKEIGIRKVVGANIHQILSLFAKEVVVLIFVAFLFSASASYYLMNQWLNGFEYRIDIGWEIIVGALLITAVVTVLTMGFRSVAAARVNPVDVLKDE